MLRLSGSDLMLKDKSRDLSESYEIHPTEISLKAKQQHKTPTNSSITQQLAVDLFRSVK